MKKNENGFVVSRISDAGLEKPILKIDKSNLIKAILCFLFPLSTLFSDITPFGLGFYSAIFSVKSWGIYLFFSIFSTLFSHSYSKLVYVLSYIVVTFIFALFEKQTKKAYIKGVCASFVFLSFCIVSSLGKEYFYYRVLKAVLESMIIFIGVLIFSSSLQSLTYIGKREYLSQNEIISLCFSFAFLILSFNIFTFNSYFSTPLFIGILSMMIFCYVEKSSLSLILSVCLCTILSLGDNSLWFVSVSLPFGALLSILLSNFKKAGIALGFTFAVCFSSLFIPIDEMLITSIYETLFASIIFAIIPKKITDALSSFTKKANLSQTHSKNDQSLNYYAQRLNFIGNSIDGLSSYYKNSLSKDAQKREIQSLMASQLDAISKTIKKECKNIVSMRHEEKEDKLWAHLDKNGIHPKRIYINSPNGNLYISISIKDIDFKKDTKDIICSIIHQVLDVRCEYASVKRLNDEYVLLFCKESTFKATFGYATKIKTGQKVSGDSFNVFYLEKNKMVMVLSDAMGSGEGAHYQSLNAVSLFEKFINSGFNTELALGLINSSFILKNDKESFATIDLCDVDLENNVLKFSKSGGATAYIKSGGKVTKISSESLPLGIVNEAKPQKFTHPIVSDSVVVLVSDGVTDIELRDKSKENFIQKELLKINSQNAQIIASKLLKQAFKISGSNAKDDMTVLVCCISKKEKEV